MWLSADAQKEEPKERRLQTFLALMYFDVLENRGLDVLETRGRDAFELLTYWSCVFLVH